jgi:hypothetical protein
MPPWPARAALVVPPVEVLPPLGGMPPEVLPPMPPNAINMPALPLTVPSEPPAPLEDPLLELEGLLFEHAASDRTIVHVIE